MHPEHTGKHVHVAPENPLFLWYILIIVGLVLLGGLSSGLTLGLMGLDSVNLQVLSVAGTNEERRRAAKVLRLLQTGRHTILVVLLLGNTVVNTSLPIFLDSLIGGGWIAVLGSTVLEVIFGAVCSRYGLAIGSAFVPVVRVCVMLLYPIAKPIAMLLDRYLGSSEQGITYSKAELKTFVSLGVEDHLGQDEISLLGSVIEFADKTVGDTMTAIEDVYDLRSDRILDDELVSEILKTGHSRIPIYESKGAYIGCMMLRDLVEYDPADLRPVSDFAIHALPHGPPDLPLLEAMAYFQTGRSHILLVTATPGEETGAIGVVTLEDVVEELIGGEIIDETDQYVDNHSRVPVIRRRRPSNHPGLKRIFEGRLARRRTILGNRDKRGKSTTTGSPLVDSA